MITRAENRFGSLSELIARQAVTPRQPVRVVTVAVAAILAIGVLDYVTGAELSFAIFYLVPVAGATLFLPNAYGYALAALASATWAIPEWVATRQTQTALTWNAVGRLVTFCFVVYLLGTLRATIERLSQSEQASREFLTTAAHQLRTPVAGLVASAEALTYETDPERRSGLVDNLIAGTNRTRRLLASLLEMSRLDQAIPSDRRPVELVGVVRREVDGVAITHPEVTVSYEGPDRLEVTASGDSVREALSNLLDNAVRHADERVTVSVAANGTGVVIDVEDDGPGLPVGAEDRAFERFVSLDGAGGSGLGLAIARASLQASGGDLTYERSRFRISLP